MPFKIRVTGLLIATACLLLTASNVPAQWKKLETGTLSWLYALEFADEKRGWAGGSNGSLIVTADGGSTWQRAPFPNRDTIRDIVFTDQRNGWLLCERSDPQGERSINRSYLMRTDDSGISWTKLEFASELSRMVRLIVAAPGEGFAIGEGGVIAGLPTGAKFPAKVGLPVRFLMLGGAWIDPTRLVLVGGGGTAIISDDLGSNWQTARTPDGLSETRLSSVFFSDGSRGWVAGYRGTVLYTVNGGRSWVQPAKVTTEDLLDVRFTDGRHGFAVGDKGTIIRSDDGGVNWRKVESPTPHSLGRLEFAGRKVFAAGFGGTIVAADIGGS